MSQFLPLLCLLCIFHQSLSISLLVKILMKKNTVLLDHPIEKGQGSWKLKISYYLLLHLKPTHWSRFIHAYYIGALSLLGYFYVFNISGRLFTFWSAQEHMKIIIYWIFFFHLTVSLSTKKWSFEVYFMFITYCEDVEHYGLMHSNINVFLSSFFSIFCFYNLVLFFWSMDHYGMWIQEWERVRESWNKVDIFIGTFYNFSVDEKNAFSTLLDNNKY